jgi:hypothetical protein
MHKQTETSANSKSIKLLKHAKRSQGNSSEKHKLITPINNAKTVFIMIHISTSTTITTTTTTTITTTNTTTTTTTSTTTTTTTTTTITTATAHTSTCCASGALVRFCICFLYRIHFLLP